MEGAVKIDIFLKALRQNDCGAFLSDGGPHPLERSLKQLALEIDNLVQRNRRAVGKLQDPRNVIDFFQLSHGRDILAAILLFVRTEPDHGDLRPLCDPVGQNLLFEIQHMQFLLMKQHVFRRWFIQGKLVMLLLNEPVIGILPTG